MNTINDIIKAELELRRLKMAISSLNNVKEKEEIIKSAKQLDYDQETAVMNLLEKTDKIYDSLVQENFDLLINNEIEFDVIKEETKTFKTHAIKFDGKVHDDGLFYCHTTETNFTFLNFYPLSYVGLINYFGEADIYIDEKESQFFTSKTPQKFVGSINTKGGLFLKATESSSEVSGKIYVNTFTADLFSGDFVKRDQFLKNNSKIRKMLSDYRNNLS